MKIDAATTTHLEDLARMHIGHRITARWGVTLEPQKLVAVVEYPTSNDVALVCENSPWDEHYGFIVSTTASHHVDGQNNVSGFWCLDCTNAPEEEDYLAQVKQRDKLVQYVHGWCFDNAFATRNVPTPAQIREVLKALDALVAEEGTE